MQFKVYTDGSYRDGIWGAGAILIAPNGEIKKFSSYGNDEHGSRNVAGEIQAAINGLRALFKLVSSDEKHEVVIYHDYEGIGKWADGSWKAKAPDAIAYKEAIAKAREYFDISFVKVKAHSGDKYNELADQLAGFAMEEGFKKLQNSSAEESGTTEVRISLRIDSATLAQDFGSMDTLLAIIEKETGCKITKL